MKLALLGYGKMGKEVERVARSKGHEIVLVIDADNAQDLTAENLKKADAAIEFSTPHTAVPNICACFKAGVPIVVGTTAWYPQFEDVKKQCAEANGALFYATNFSVGVNIFFHLNRQLAKLLSAYKEYNVEIEEIHHTQKLDAPSGTAITAAEGIIENIGRKKEWKNILGSSGTGNITLTEQDILIRSVREENVPGTHTVTYRSEVDTLELRHVAHSRAGFAAGAVLAAEWIIGKQGIYTMHDLLQF